MTEIGSLFVRLGLRGKEFNRGMAKASKQVTGLKKQVGGLGEHLSRMRNLAIAGFAGWGIKRISGSFVEAASSAEQYRVRLSVLLKSQKEGDRMFKEMAAFASKVPFEYEKIMASATALSGVMKGGVAEVKKWMPMIADLAAVSGLSIEETTQQVIRMYSAGAGAADLFRERGILAMMGFKAGVSYTAEETRKKMMDEWQKAGSQFKGATDKLAETWGGLVSMMHDAWFQLRTAIMEAGVFDFIKSGLSIVLDNINKLKEGGSKFDEWVKGVADKIVTALEWILKDIALVSDAFWGWQMIWEGLKLAFSVFAKFVSAGFQKILSYALKAAQAIGVEDVAFSVAKALGRANTAQEYWNEAIDKSNKRLLELAGQQSNLEKVGKVIDKMRASMESKIKPKVDVKEIEDTWGYLNGEYVNLKDIIGKNALKPTADTFNVVQAFDEVENKWKATVKRIESVKPQVTVTTSFKGEGSSIKPLSEKIQEMEGKMKNFASEVNSLGMAPTVDFSQVSNQISVMIELSKAMAAARRAQVGPPGTAMRTAGWASEMRLRELWKIGMGALRQPAPKASLESGLERRGDNNTFNITIAPTFMTGDRASMRQVAADLKEALQELDHRWN